MDRTQLGADLSAARKLVAMRVLTVPAEQLDRSRNSKWSSVQHLDHIHRSVRPVAFALLVPSWMLRWCVRKPHRPSRSCVKPVARYKDELAAAGHAPGAFAPPRIQAMEVARMVHAA